MPLIPRYSRWYAAWRATPFIPLALLAWAHAPQAQAQAPGSVQLDPGPTLQASAAGTPVPALVYQSVFADLPRGVEDTVRDWKAANAAVAQFPRGHADLLKWEQARKAAPPPLPAQGVQP